MRLRKMWVTAGCGLALCAAAAMWMSPSTGAARAGAAVVPASVQVEGQPEGRPGQQGAAIAPEQVRQMLEEQGKPAAEHQNLQPLAGTFQAEMQFLMEEGGQPEVSHGVSKNVWIMGDKFLQMNFEGTLKFAGAEFPFRGMGILGFDKVAGQYTMMWVDSLSTTMLTSQGRPGESATEIAVSGSTVSPMGAVEMKHVFKIESKDKHVLEFWQGASGQKEMMKVGWITYTRKAD
ncbi:MAG: DUF1579 domain-containing protein [Leptolyngbya sp. PLA3]|nr:MAG: DUF1579 domain-containing protein [Cyanobacteria bacterium CYA]MCE7968690.1 DUF1579 domain-containing protein [Leptolyngbya sp. PL-A3]